MKTVGMGRDSAHGMHRDGATNHLLMMLPAPICPRLIKGNFLLESNFGKFCCNAADSVSVDTGLVGDCIWAILIVEITFCQQLKYGPRFSAVG